MPSKGRDRIAEILRILRETYPDARTALDYGSTFELLVAVILSAQCTDVRVNMVTKKLFARYRTAEDFARLTPEELEPWIASCGLGPAKARNLVATARILVERYRGEVPGTMEELVALPGVGRKTANVMLANAFGIPAIAVDTHVFRVANRLGLARSKDVLGTERDLMRTLPKETWIQAHHWLIWHGRELCKAQRPLCDRCPLAPLCPHYRSLIRA